jgi:hypothetical protein
VIDGCTIEGCIMSAISIGPEYYWNEANYVWNLTISNNTIRDCNKHGTEHGVIFVHGDGAIGNRKIIIRNNRIETGPCRYVLNLQWADGIDIASNAFVNAPYETPVRAPSMIWLSHCRNVKFTDNTVTQQGSYPGNLLGEGPDVLGTVNNRGIRVVSAPATR